MAEVKVKITAANQTQTGFQSVLADAQKTATQVQQTFARATAQVRPAQNIFAPDPSKVGPIDIGDYGLGPLRELQEQLRQARESAQQAFDPQPPQQFGNSVAGVIGRFALLIGAAATVGKIIASAFDQAGAAVAAAVRIQEQFNNALQDAGRATNLSGAIAEFRQLNGLAEQTGRTLDESFGRTFGEAFANVFQGRPGQLLARLGSVLTGNSPIATIQQNQAQQRSIALSTLDASLETQINDLRDIAATGGNREATDLLRLQQERRNQLQTLKTSLENAGASDAEIAARVNRFNEVAALQDQVTANEKRLETERDITREKEKQAALESGTRRGDVIGRQLGPGNFEGIEELRRQQEAAARGLGPVFGPGTAEAAAGGFRVDAANFARQQQEEALRLAQQQAQQSAFGGDFGASALQRIGGASTEFFRVRGDDPKELQRRGNEFLRRILQALEKGEPLVLGNSR